MVVWENPSDAAIAKNSKNIDQKDGIFTYNTFDTFNLEAISMSGEIEIEMI